MPPDPKEVGGDTVRWMRFRARHTNVDPMTRHRTAALLGTTAALVLVPAATSAAALIAPLDVRVTAHVRPGSVLQGAWNAYSTPEGGRWIGENLKLVETWQRATPTATRVRGRASGGPSRRHFVDVNYLARRTGEGVLAEEQAAGATTPPLELHCAASGSEGPGHSITTEGRTSMQVIDQPRRGRVVVRGPGIAFLGPQCRPSGRELPVRGVGIHPPVFTKPWIPQGAQGPWEFSIPRAEFAAGGTFRFRDSYSLAFRIEDFTTMDVAGTALTSGKVAIDLRVRRVGR
jgi:hypothetical protein